MHAHAHAQGANLERGNEGNAQKTLSKSDLLVRRSRSSLISLHLHCIHRLVAPAERDERGRPNYEGVWPFVLLEMWRGCKLLMCIVWTAVRTGRIKRVELSSTGNRCAGGTVQKEGCASTARVASSASSSFRAVWLGRRKQTSRTRSNHSGKVKLGCRTRQPRAEAVRTPHNRLCDPSRPAVE